MSVEQLLSHPGRELCHLTSLMSEHEVLVVVLIILTVVAAGATALFLIDRVGRSENWSPRTGNLRRERRGL